MALHGSWPFCNRRLGCAGRVCVRALHRYHDERLIRFAHPGLKSWAGARDSSPTRAKNARRGPGKRIA